MAKALRRSQCLIGRPLATCRPSTGPIGFFPVDHESVNYLRATGRTEEECFAFENYFRARTCLACREKAKLITASTSIWILADVQPSVAGPKRPQDRINLPELGKGSRTAGKTGARRRLRKEAGRSSRKACRRIEWQCATQRRDVFY